MEQNNFHDISWLTVNSFINYLIIMVKVYFSAHCTHKGGEVIVYDHEFMNI